MIARLSRDVDGLTIDRLNTIHLVLTGGQRFDHSSPQPVLLRRGALRAMLSSTHLSPIEGQSQRAVQIHAEPWYVADARRPRLIEPEGDPARVSAPARPPHGPLRLSPASRWLTCGQAELEQLRCPVRALQLSIWVQHAVLAIRPYQVRLPYLDCALTNAQSGNGQISRLIGALPLLRVGLPPTFLCLNVAGQNAQILTKVLRETCKGAI